MLHLYYIINQLPNESSLYVGKMLIFKKFLWHWWFLVSLSIYDCATEAMWSQPAANCYNAIIQWMAMTLRGHLPNYERVIRQKDDMLHQ